MRWLGGSVERIGYPADRAAARTALFDAASGADLVLVVGVDSVDPLEGTWRDLIDAGASVTRPGLPAHPGSSYWLVTLRDVPVIGVGSCGMFCAAPCICSSIRRFAGGSLDREFLAGLGHGGRLLGAEQRLRIPVYDRRSERDER